MIPEGARVLLVEGSGKRHLMKTAKDFVEVPGLGVVDGAAVCNAGFGDSIRVGGKELVILKPSLSDLLSLIERRAQIMVPKDSYIIPLQLDLGCGSRVIEGGVGSGALTVVLLKAVGPSGRVFSYEMREDHAKLARRNVSLSDNAEAWELRLKDICTAELEKEVDAAFLDIPNPWDALANVSKAIRAGGQVGCYVPNANQLDTAVRKMREIGLSDIVAFETLRREMVVHEGGIRPSFDMMGHTGYMAFGRKMRL